MWVVGIDEVSDYWRVKVREGGGGGHYAFFLICFDLHMLFPFQCIGCIFSLKL
jgi:hypothetical protein